MAERKICPSCGMLDLVDGKCESCGYVESKAGKAKEEKPKRK